MRDRLSWHFLEAELQVKGRTLPYKFLTSFYKDQRYLLTCIYLKGEESKLFNPFHNGYQAVKYYCFRDFNEEKENRTAKEKKTGSMDKTMASKKKYIIVYFQICWMNFDKRI